MRDLGSIQSPQNSFLLNLGLETLHLRMPQHCRNAQKVAEYLSKNEKVAWVNYCGLPDNKYYALAQKYMSRYPGYAKYGSAYHTSSGNYSRNGNYFRWNRNTLSDPDGYLSKTADQILADLFS